MALAHFVRAFVENGAKVAFLDQQRETGATLADSLGEGAARPLFLPCDLADIAALRASRKASSTSWVSRLGECTLERRGKPAWHCDRQRRASSAWSKRFMR